MRSELAALGPWLVAFGLVTAPVAAAAQEASASGALGAGVFGSEAAAAAEVGVDVSGAQYALGLGGRLRWVADEGVRTRDWDEPSEWATFVRYLMYAREAPAHGDGVGVVAAMGPLGNVGLGHGALIQGFTTGLDVDHRHLGAQLRVERGRFGVEGLLDDVIAPRVAGMRGYWQRSGRHHGLGLGMSTAADFAAPRTVMAPGEAMSAVEAGFLPMVALDGSARLQDQSATGAQRIAGTAHAELAAIGAVAAGLHLGLTLDGVLGATRLAASGALIAGTDGYVPGWVGPLYERDRVQLGEAPGAPSQLDRARAGGLGHLGSRFALFGQHAGLGDVELVYAQRSGLPDLATTRVAAPYLRAVQGALWGAVEIRGQARVLALELRARLPRGLFVTMEAARLYRAVDEMAAPGALASWWQATMSLGAAVELGRGDRTGASQAATPY
jgi:hypothetical protein